MTPLARKILEMSQVDPVRLVYGAMASASTVKVGGSEVAVTLPKLAAVGALSAGDYVAVLTVGADSLIVGRVAAAASAGVCVVTGTKTAVTATNTTLDTMVDEYDPDNWGTAGGVTPPAGHYLVTLQVDWQSMAATDRIIAQLQRGGSAFAQDDSQSGSTSPNRSVSGVIIVNGSDLISGSIFQASGVNRTADVRMSVVRV